MLKLLKVKNFALMEDLTIDFENRLTVVTGETGAGKSMIVEAIATLCGSRMEDVLIRSGKDFAEVTGIFGIGKVSKERLIKSGIEVDNDIIIRRKIERGKRQNAYINDSVVSLNLLKEVTQEMVDLIGQYENQSLFYPKNHLLLLDSFAGITDMRQAYTNMYDEYKGLQNRLDDLLETVRQKDEKIDYLKYQIDEIEKAKFQPGEEEALTEEKNLLLTSERRSVLSAEILMHLYEAEGSALENLSKVEKQLAELKTLDPNLAITHERLDSLLSSVDDIYRDMSSYNNQIDFSQQRLDDVVERLETISKIKKKYGKTIDEVHKYLVAIKKEVALIETHDEEVKRVRESLAETEKRVHKMAEELSKNRHVAAVSLKRRMLQLVSKLGMKKANFEVRFTDREINETGTDEAEFYISTNPGEELKPLRKIASGGEVSRITLSLKTILSGVDKIPTIIFDEVDTGIGGRIAEAVGTLLAEVSKEHQIICITHLPQISVSADNHILVRKEIKGKETFTKVEKIKGEMRKMEIARMLGGKKITKKTVDHAAEFLQKTQRK